MTSINPHYTFFYSQPEHYRFSHDSVFLARRAFELFKSQISTQTRVLDLCAGCGIVGMDFLFHCQSELGYTPSICDFLELQEEYASHFEINKRNLHHISCLMQFFQTNHIHFCDGSYDLILCNPPYFQPGDGKLSPNEFKNRCRFFLDGSQEDLFQTIKRLLVPSGKALVLMRAEAPPQATGLLSFKQQPIRGTPLFLFSRES